MLYPRLQIVLQFLEKHYESLESVDFPSNFKKLTFPDYQLTPYDYLEFARLAHNQNTTAERINCISHIKRAVECELDTLLHLLGISTQTLNFPSKMNFVRGAFLISNQSLNTLNRLRNKIEHNYETPDSTDLTIYFDMAEAFIMAMEGYIYMLKDSPGIALGNFELEGYRMRIKTEPRLIIKLQTTPPSIIFEIKDTGSHGIIEIEHSTFDEYAQAVGILLLLVRSNA